MDNESNVRGDRAGRRNKFIVGLKIIEVRLRFIVILVAVGLVIGYWDTIKNHWDKWTRPGTTVIAELGGDTEFYCPMHPSVVRQGLDPGGQLPKCPICGMPLSKRKKGVPPELPEGVTGRVQLSPDRVRLAGIQTVAVAYLPITKEINTVGFVDYDESRLARIVTRVDGYLDKLLVDRTWITVQKGDPLAEIYSAELYSTAQDLGVASERKEEQLVRSIRERMRLLGVGDREIDEIIRSGQANSLLVIRSPQAGHVIRKEVRQGDHVEPGKVLFEVADLSVVWIEAEVYERDIPFLQVGQAIEARVESALNRVFAGKVTLVHPHLETTTRTNSVRLELENPMHELRPGMFASVRIQKPLAEIEPFKSQLAAGLQLQAKPGEVLAIPERSVVDTGSRKIVYVEREPGLFEGVLVELGPRTGGFYPVVNGLKAGDRVAAAGAFLIDAETRLNPAAASAYLGASGGPQSGKSGGTNTNRRDPGRKTSSATATRGDDKYAAVPAKLTAKELAVVNNLAPADRAAALAQALCPVSDDPLGSMGLPFKMTVQGQPVFLCCQGCEEKANESLDDVLKRLDQLKTARQGSTKPK